MRIIVDKMDDPVAIDDVDAFLLVSVRGDDITVGGHFADISEDERRALFNNALDAFEKFAEYVYGG